MPKGFGVVWVELRDLPKIKAYIWEMRMLIDRLRVEANPLASTLESMLDRFLAALAPDEPDSEVTRQE